jgi:hypothetical protein
MLFGATVYRAQKPTRKADVITLFALCGNVSSSECRRRLQCGRNATYFMCESATLHSPTNTTQLLGISNFNLAAKKLKSSTKSRC